MPPTARHGELRRTLVLAWGLCGLVSGLALADEPLHQRIDALVAEARSVPPAELASDAEFLRRVYLDLTGIIPSAAAARAFLDDEAPDKRSALVDRLLASPGYARRMQTVFDVMWMERRGDTHVPSEAWREYLRQSFAANKPYNVLVREVLSADGADPALRPAAKFILDREAEPNILTRDVGRFFLGVDLQCAQCHDHPLIYDYYQRDYYGLFAFFNRSSVFTDQKLGPVLAEKADGDVTYTSVFDPDAGTMQSRPKMLGGLQLAEPAFAEGQAYVVAPADGVRPLPRYSRREQLARQLTQTRQRDFSRNIVNRLWALVMGRGLVDPVDLHHEENPPSHSELLELLADEFVAMGYDIKALLRELVLSETYQRASLLPDGVDTEEIPPEAYAVAELKPLSPEQLAWSLMQATGAVDNTRASLESQIEADRRLAEIVGSQAAGDSLSAELIEAATHTALAGNVGAFVSLFGSQPGAGGSDFEATVHQALFLSNGGTIQSWLQPAGGNLTARLEAISEPNELTLELYLSVLSRRPDGDEQSAAIAFLGSHDGAERLSAIQQMAWALLASAEFRLNH